MSVRELIANLQACVDEDPAVANHKVIIRIRYYAGGDGEDLEFADEVNDIEYGGYNNSDKLYLQND